MSASGASRQNGWTALVAILLQYGGALHFDGLTSSNRRVVAEVDRKAPLKGRASSSLGKPTTLQVHSVQPKTVEAVH